ncbi:MAG: ParA family protein [Paludibacter sp.]|nr:ParA family protein [Paludibacter sp.]
MIVFGIYNIKGGVGKTATSVNLSYLSSLDGYKTLLWDLDPQGSSSFYYDKEQRNDASLKKIITGKVELRDIISETDYRKLDIIPSDFSYRHMDTTLDQTKKSKKRIREALKELKKDYEVVFLDCPPGISILAENIFHACDYILVPTVPTPLCLRTYEQIITFFEEDELDKSSVIPFLSMVETRKSVHQNSMKELNLNIPNLCHSSIPFLAEVEKMGIYRKPLIEFSPNSKASTSFKALWKEIKKIASLKN